MSWSLFALSQVLTPKRMGIAALVLVAIGLAALVVLGTRDADRRHRECTGPHKSWDSTEDECVVEVGFGGRS